MPDAPPPGRPASSPPGEFSYPSTRVVGDELWVTYTWQRRGIALTRVPLDLLAGE